MVSKAFPRFWSDPTLGTPQNDFWPESKWPFLEGFFGPFALDGPVKKNETIYWRFGRDQFHSFLQDHQKERANWRNRKNRFLVKIRAAVQNGRFGWPPDLAQPRSGKPL
jgi:hypothetical protein